MTHKKIKPSLSLVSGNEQPSDLLSTGFPSLNRITGCVRFNDLVILGGQSNSGKSALALSLAWYLGYSRRKRVWYGLPEIASRELTSSLLKLGPGYLRYNLICPVYSKAKSYHPQTIIIKKPSFKLEDYSKELNNTPKELHPGMIIIDPIENVLLSHIQDTQFEDIDHILL